MNVGIASDTEEFELKEELAAKLRAAGYTVTDFGAHSLDPGDETIRTSLFRSRTQWPPVKWIVALQSAAAAWVHPFAPIRLKGIRAALIHDHFSARQGVEDDHMNVPCMGGASAHLTPPAGIGEWQPLREPSADLATMNVARHAVVGAGVRAIAISSSRLR